MLVQSKIVSLLNEVLNQTARLRKGGLQATYHCPFCPDKNLITMKLEIALGGSNTGNYHCWRCNVKGKTLGSLLKKLKAPTIYRERLFKLTGDIKILRSKRVDYETVILPDEFLPLSKHRNTPEYRNAMFYLKQRQVLPEDILRYNIGYCEEGEYAYHIIIPSYDAKCELNFFIGRRYYDTPGAIPYKKPECSMNIVGFESFINYDDPINLCEGVFDAIAIRNNAIPLFGKFLSSKLREQLLINKVKQVNMILDNDALSDAVKNCEIIQRLGIEVRLVKLENKDPSVLGFNCIHEIIRDAEPFGFMELLRYKVNL